MYQYSEAGNVENAIKELIKSETKSSVVASLADQPGMTHLR